MAAAFRAAMASADPGIAAFNAMGRAYVHFALAHPSLFRLMMAQSGGPVPTPPPTQGQNAEEGSDGMQILVNAIDGLFGLGFGFSSCPDVCPITLSTLAQARKELGAEAKAAAQASAAKAAGSAQARQKLPVEEIAVPGGFTEVRVGERAMREERVCVQPDGTLSACNDKP